MFTGGTAGEDERIDPQGEQDRTNAAPYGSNYPKEETCTQDSDVPLAIPTQAGPEPDPGKSDANRKLCKVYSDTIHCSDGWHLDGRIDDDSIWQKWYNVVMANPHQLYLSPQGKIRAKIVSFMASELHRV